MPPIVEKRSLTIRSGSGSNRFSPTRLEQERSWAYLQMQKSDLAVRHTIGLRHAFTLYATRLIT